MDFEFRHTEDSHVKTNIVHTLFRIRKYGLMSIDQFRDLLSPADIDRCKKSQKKTWYSLSLNVFTNFIFQVIYTFYFLPLFVVMESSFHCVFYILQPMSNSGLTYVHSLTCSRFVQHELGLAADDGVRQLVEQSEGEVSPADKTAAMKSAVEKRVVALRMKMGKLVAVSNPELTDGWLREVRIVNLFLFNL